MKYRRKYYDKQVSRQGKKTYASKLMKNKIVPACGTA